MRRAVAPATAGAVLPERCSPGADVGAHAAVAAQQRLLEGGCMLSTDASFSPTAELHLPSTCEVPASFAPGCMDRRALDFSPSALQPHRCTYATDGCTSSTALNFNRGATRDDGSCIEPVVGCTVSDELGGGGGAPLFFLGVPLTGAVTLPPTAKHVLNYNPAANVLDGCEMAIEGCTDSRAVNYDPLANTNSSAWCIPRHTGCMLPESPSFDPTATVSDPSRCAVRAKGCMSSSSINFDARATIDDGSCFEPRLGCLHPKALNFNCVHSAPLDPTLDCLSSTELRATVHAPHTCAYPPPPPYALIIGGAFASAALLVAFVLYCRRRSAKVDAAAAFVFVKSHGTPVLHAVANAPRAVESARAYLSAPQERGAGHTDCTLTAR